VTGLPVARQRCDRAFFPDSIDGTRYFGTVNGAMTLVQTLGSFFGPLLVGALVDETGSYTIGWLVYAAFAALSVPLATSRQATVQPWVCGGEVEEVSATVSNAPQPDETAAPRE
jgi:nitrate/nitrite transporter NarK